MDIQRAKEIASSPDMINVTYNGIPIYIENISEEENTACIHALAQPDNRKEVSLSSLSEEK